MTKNLLCNGWPKVPTVDLGVALNTNSSLSCRSSNGLIKVSPTTSGSFVFLLFWERGGGGLGHDGISFTSIKFCSPMVVSCNLVCMEQSPGSFF